MEYNKTPNLAALAQDAKDTMDTSVNDLLDRARERGMSAETLAALEGQLRLNAEQHDRLQDENLQRPKR